MLVITDDSYKEKGSMVFGITEIDLDFDRLRCLQRVCNSHIFHMCPMLVYAWMELHFFHASNYLDNYQIFTRGFT